MSSQPEQSAILPRQRESTEYRVETPTFSLIVPTRKRTDQLRCLLDSLADTASHPERLEILLVIDEDDPDSLAFREERLQVQHIVRPPGLTMGALNRAGCEAATGRYFMLLNDDVIARTPGWDDRVLECFRRFPDDIALIHTNDMIFKDWLCTFPIVSRAFCELVGGICPYEYRRYRIDDHIGDLFHLLAVLGEQRIVWLPEVVFEHANYVEEEGHKRCYTSDPELLEVDASLFESLFAQRKELALQLREYIERQARKSRVEGWRRALDEVPDSLCLRFPSRLRVESGLEQRTSANTRVTIGVISFRSDGPDCRDTVESIKATTTNCELLVLDHEHAEGFQFSRELNRLASAARTDHVVLLHDQVRVHPGWLDGLLRALTPGVGIATPLQLAGDGETAFAGVVFHPDGSGHHGHLVTMPRETIPVLSVCNPVMLLDRTHWRQRLFSEEYRHYFFDLDLGLRAWEEGLHVVCTPEATVTCRPGKSSPYGLGLLEEGFEADRQMFVARWMTTGRYRRLVEGMWDAIPALRELLQLCDDVRDDPLNARGRTQNIPILRHALGETVRVAASKGEAEKKRLRRLFGRAARWLRSPASATIPSLPALPPNPTRDARGLI